MQAQECIYQSQPCDSSSSCEEDAEAPCGGIVSEEQCVTPCIADTNQTWLCDCSRRLSSSCWSLSLVRFFPKLKTEDLLLGVLPQNEQQRFFQPRVLFIAPSCELVLVLELCFVPLALRFSFSLPLLERICRAQLGEQTTWERARISRINRRSREQSLTRPCP